MWNHCRSLIVTSLLWIPVNKHDCLTGVVFITTKESRALTPWCSHSDCVVPFCNHGLREGLCDPGVTSDFAHCNAVTFQIHIIISCFSLIPGEGKFLCKWLSPFYLLERKPVDGTYSIFSPSATKNLQMKLKLQLWCLIFSHHRSESNPSTAFGWF